jgi:hypothetical protein
LLNNEIGPIDFLGRNDGFHFITHYLGKAKSEKAKSESLLALPQKSDYSVTFGANSISAPKINLTDSRQEDYDR